MNIEKVNIAQKFRLFRDQWNPRVLGELNGQQIRAVKMQGTFVWHQHEHEDEMFLVTRGVLQMEFRDRTIEIGEGEFIIVPKQVEHRPVAQQEVEVLLFEPASTLNTGNTVGGRTRTQLEKI